MKIIERLFLARFQPHVLACPNFSNHQSAYRPRHSTETENIISGSFTLFIITASVRSGTPILSAVADEWPSHKHCATSVCPYRSAGAQFKLSIVGGVGLLLNATSKRGWLTSTRMIYTSHDVFPCKDVPFGGSVDISPHLRGKIPQNRNFGGVNKHFQAKHAKYSNCHIIKTTIWIPTKFCTSVKTTKYASWVVQKRGKQIQDSGQLPSWKKS